MILMLLLWPFSAFFSTQMRRTPSAYWARTESVSALRGSRMERFALPTRRSLTWKFSVSSLCSSRRSVCTVRMSSSTEMSMSSFLCPGRSTWMRNSRSVSLEETKV